MVSIDDSSCLPPTPGSSRSDERQPVGSKSTQKDQYTGENRVPEILAKAAVAARKQIVAGVGRRGRAAPRTKAPSSRAQDPKALRISKDDDRVRNLKEIVADDERWKLFALGALELQPGSESSESLRECLQQDLEEDSWDGIADLVGLYSQNASRSENTGTAAPDEELSAGSTERTKLWLTFPDYFENLFSAVREKSLPQEMKLYTSDLLIQYLGTIGQ